MSFVSRDVKVRNPRSGEYDYRFTQLSAEHLDEECQRLRSFQRSWRALPVRERADHLNALAARMRDARDDLVAALVADTGRLGESYLEVDATLGAIARWAKLAPTLLEEPEQQATSLPGISVGPQYAPYDLLGVISPWNFPLLLALIDAIPALLAGCAVIIKPSEITPRFIEPLRACIDEVPQISAVLSVQAGEGDLGAAIIDRVDVLCFTGSVATGQKVAQAAAANFIPANLELGGKDPAIVCDDADLKRTAAAITWGGMVNAGQSCLSIERIHVQESIHEAFCAEICAAVQALNINYPNISKGEIGPIISLAQADIIRRHLDDAKAKGGRVLCGGNIEEHDGGLWCQPTLVADASAQMLLVREETFAPVLPILAFTDDAAAVAQANDSEFGLSAAVFSGDRERAHAIARQLDAGAISINDAALTSIMHEGEKQAFKRSGMGGSRMGLVSIRRFFRPKALIENTECTWDPWWFSQPEGVDS